MAWANVALIILGALLSPSIVNQWLKTLGININAADLQNGFSGTAVSQGATATTPGATAEQAKPPAVAQTVNDAVKNPVSLFGIAAVGFVGVFVISQLRAASHEAGTAAVDVYNEGKRVSGSLSNADASTKNISRRASN